MTWTNAFAIGDCAIEVYNFGALIAEADYPLYGVEVSVDAAGLVTLTGPDGADLEVRVVPAFDTASRPVRVTEVVNGIAQRTEAVWSPDPAGVELFLTDTHEFSPAQAWSYGGVHVYTPIT